MMRATVSAQALPLAMPSSTARPTRGCRKARNTVTDAQPLATALVQYEQSWGSRKEVIKKGNWDETSGTCTLFSPGGAVEKETALGKGER